MCAYRCAQLSYTTQRRAVLIIFPLYLQITTTTQCCLSEERGPALPKTFIFKQQQEYVAHTQPFNGPLSGTTRVSRYQKSKTNLDFTQARDSKWQWHQLGHMQVCTSLQTDNHASHTTTQVFLQTGCPSCRPTNSVKALKAKQYVS